MYGVDPFVSDIGSPDMGVMGSDPFLCADTAQKALHFQGHLQRSSQP